jgi:hypothetical protein
MHRSRRGQIADAFCRDTFGSETRRRRACTSQRSTDSIRDFIDPKRAASSPCYWEHRDGRMLSGGWCAGWRLFCHRDQARICDSRALTQRDASEDQLKSPVPSLTSVHVLAGQVASEPDAASRRCILAVIPGGTVCGRQSSDRGTSVVGALLTIPFFKTAIAERYLPHWGRPCKHLVQLKTRVGKLVTDDEGRYCIYLRW